MVFNIQELPNAFFSNNPAAIRLRNKFKNPPNIKNFCINKLKDIFLSSENINFVNKTIVNIVKNELNIKIPLQNPIEIYIIAQYIFDYESGNQNFYLEKQIKYLNAKLIEYIKPKLYENMKSKVKHLQHLKDIENNKRCFIPRPISVGRSKKPTESLSNKIIFKY